MSYGNESYGSQSKGIVVKIEKVLQVDNMNMNGNVDAHVLSQEKSDTVIKVCGDLQTQTRSNLSPYAQSVEYLEDIKDQWLL